MTASSKFKVMRWVAGLFFIAPILASIYFILRGESGFGGWLVFSAFGVLLWKVEKTLRLNRIERLMMRHRGEF